MLEGFIIIAVRVDRHHKSRRGGLLKSVFNFETHPVGAVQLTYNV
jgi:hypothetical protein